MTDDFRYRGARACHLLHARELRAFLDVWRRADAAGFVPPRGEDPDYDSLEHLSHHVLRSARGYMAWCCAQLGLPEPDLPRVPAVEDVRALAGDFAEALSARWALPLREVEEERFGEVFEAPWKLPYSIDSMLEHAVMHPLRHRFQLEEWLA